MLIHTAEGKRSIDEELVLCIGRHRGESERCTVTVYLLSGEREYRHPGEYAPRRRFTAVGCVTQCREPMSYLHHCAAGRDICAYQDGGAGRLGRLTVQQA